MDDEDRATLAALARTLGLRLEPSRFTGHTTLEGLFEGRPLKLFFPIDGPALLECGLDPTLDLGLYVSSRELSSQGLPWSGSRVLVNDSDWDDELWSAADEPRRGRVLLTPGLRKSIINLNICAPSFVLDDTLVRAPHATGWTNVQSTLDMLLEIARRLEAAREHVPPAEALAAHAEAFERIAAARELDFSATPCRLFGHDEDRDIDLFFRRVGAHRHRFFLNVSSRSMRPFGLLVRRQTLVDGVRKVFGATDVEVGEAAFDAAFLVEAREPDRALSALDEAARAALLEMVERFDRVTLDDAGIHVEGKIEEAFAGKIDGLLGAAEAVVDQVARASLREVRGPYR